MNAANHNKLIPYRELGNTGEMRSILGIGGWHLGAPDVDEQLAIRIVRTAIDAHQLPGQLLALARHTSRD